MCQVCESTFRICEFGNNGFYINKMDNGEYRFKMETQRSTLSSRQIGYDISYSTPISYCPYCGRDLTLEIIKEDTNDPQIFKSVFDYIRTLPERTDKWRYAVDLACDYTNNGKDPDKFIDEIIKKVEKFK